MFDPLLFRDGKNESFHWLISQMLGNAERLAFMGVFNFTDRFGSKYLFINKNDSIMRFPEFTDSILKIQAPLFIFIFFIRVILLDPFYLLGPNLMLMIEITKQCRVYSMILKVSME